MRYIIFGALCCTAFVAWFATRAPVEPPPAESMPVQRNIAPPPVEAVNDGFAQPIALSSMPATQATDVDAPNETAEAAGFDDDIAASIETLMADPDWDEEDIDALLRSFDPDQREDARAALIEFGALGGL